MYCCYKDYAQHLNEFRKLKKCGEECAQAVGSSCFWCPFLFSFYRVTQNKVHHLLAILNLILEVNNTQVSYVIQCIIVNEVQFNEVLF